ncbi:MAG TPA: hypothetical protein PKN75_07750 [Bacteroidia bacterium]|nr:hypothetical protein [Bacteroidia bacterium]HNU33472.1 hypothetical protein [Bacteroidia bacterium]
MRRILPAIALLFSAYPTVAQNGLENLIVEKYYISEPNDTNANIDGGVLPLGSVTYRLYADMLPGYRFQAVYGVPGHEMRIETFNNEDRGTIGFEERNIEGVYANNDILFIKDDTP